MDSNGPVKGLEDDHPISMSEPLNPVNVLPVLESTPSPIPIPTPTPTPMHCIDEIPVGNPSASKPEVNELLNMDSTTTTTTSSTTSSMNKPSDEKVQRLAAINNCLKEKSRFVSGIGNVNDKVISIMNENSPSISDRQQQEEKKSQTAEKKPVEHLEAKQKKEVEKHEEAEKQMEVGPTSSSQDKEVEEKKKASKPTPKQPSNPPKTESKSNPPYRHRITELLKASYEPVHKNLQPQSQPNSKPKPPTPMPKDTKKQSSSPNLKNPGQEEKAKPDTMNIQTSMPSTEQQQAQESLNDQLPVYSYEVLTVGLYEINLSKFFNDHNNHNHASLNKMMMINGRHLLTLVMWILQEESTISVTRTL